MSAVRRVIVPSLMLLLLLGITRASSPAAQQQPVAVHDDPLSLFAELMPVLSHERCANCHGATDPERGLYHPGAVPPTMICFQCHTASPFWKLAPTAVAFFQKSTRQLCEHFAAFEPATNDFLDRHLSQDELINQAFIGRRGGAVTREFTRPPPMTKPEFLRVFRRWVREGGAACGGWEGTITEEQSIGGIRTLDALGGKLTHWQEGKRTLTITVTDGQATVKSTVSGFDTNKQVVSTGGCEVTVYAHTVYRIVDPLAPPPPPPPPQDTVTRPPAVPVSGPGTVRVGIDAAGNYRIVVTPPGETIETTHSGNSTNTCNAPNMHQAEERDRITWKPFVIEINGRLSDPRNRRQLKGDGEIEMTSADTDHDMGIEAYGSASEVDGRNIPFKVKRSWDLTRRP